MIVAFAMTSTQTVYASLEEERLFKWEVTRVIDGDTVGILVEWGPLELRKLSVRIRGIVGGRIGAVACDCHVGRMSAS